MQGFSWNHFICYRGPLHATWSCCTWWTPAPTTERRSLRSSTSSASVKQLDGHEYLKNLSQSSGPSHWPVLLCHTMNRRDKTKEGKERQRKERASRKAATDKGANHSSTQPTDAEHLAPSDVTRSLPPVDTRGPTIPRNTGQRYSALSAQGAHNWAPGNCRPPEVVMFWGARSRTDVLLSTNCRHPKISAWPETRPVLREKWLKGMYSGSNWQRRVVFFYVSWLRSKCKNNRNKCKRYDCCRQA